jgi:hypothetical protein
LRNEILQLCSNKLKQAAFACVFAAPAATPQLPTPAAPGLFAKTGRLFDFLDRQPRFLGDRPHIQHIQQRSCHLPLHLQSCFLAGLLLSLGDRILQFKDKWFCQQNPEPYGILIAVVLNSYDQFFQFGNMIQKEFC